MAASLTLSNNYGANIRLDKSYRLAKRYHSYDNGMVFSKDPLPCGHMFKFKVQLSIDQKWGGTIKFGLTSISPDQGKIEKSASDLKELSFVVGTLEGIAYLFISGINVMRIPSDVSLRSLREGSTAGVMYSSDCTIHFFLDKIHLRVKLPHSLKLPKVLYGVVDLYGQCIGIELLSTEHSPHQPSHLIEIDSASVRPVVEELARRQEIAQKFKERNSGRGTDGEETVTQQILPVIGHPLDLCDTQVVSIQHRAFQIQPSLSKGTAPQQKLPDGGQLECEYRQLCLGFLEDKTEIRNYINYKYNKCFCKTCVFERQEPSLKICGDPPMRYATPVDWFKFGLTMIKDNQARQKQSFNKWHKAYHGTELARLESILDCGELLLPGTETGDSLTIEHCKGHYNERSKPTKHDPIQIFCSPSIKYSSCGEVYAKTSRYTDKRTQKQYDCKVCLKLLVDPDSYGVSGQTVSSDKQQIDELFSNDELEWATKRFSQVYLYGLMVKLHPVKN